VHTCAHTHANSRSEDYYIQQACAPDPYIERLVATVLALPRPQLLPPEERSDGTEPAEPAAQLQPELKAKPKPQSQPVPQPELQPEPELELEPEKRLVQPSIKEKATVTDSCISDEKGVQASATDLVGGSSVYRTSRIVAVGAPSPRSSISTVVPQAGDKVRQMRALVQQRRYPGGRNDKSVRRCQPPPSPRRWAAESCRDEQPQSTEAAELRIMTGSSASAGGKQMTVCSTMNGVVDGMPVGPDATVAAGVGKQARHALQRTHSTPPRRKSIHKHRAPLQVIPQHVQQPECSALDEMGLLDDIADDAKAVVTAVHAAPPSERSNSGGGCIDASVSGGGELPTSVSFMSSSTEGESALISPAQRHRGIVVADQDEPRGTTTAAAEEQTRSDQLSSRDADVDDHQGWESFSQQQRSLAAMESVSPVTSALSDHNGDEYSPEARRQERTEMQTEPESGPRSSDWQHTETRARTWATVPVGELHVRSSSPVADGAAAGTANASSLSPASFQFQHLSGRSEAISVPSEPGADTSRSPAPPHPEQQFELLQKLGVDVAGTWRAVLTETTKPVLPGKIKRKDLDTRAAAEQGPAAGTNLEALYAQHKRTEAEAAAEAAASLQALSCCFELHQLGSDFVTGHHVR
jgi:hypothetical protein